MLNISLKKIKYDELEVLKKYFELGIMDPKSTNPDTNTVMAVIAEIHLKIARKLLFVDRSKTHTIPLAASQAMAIIAYTDYYNSWDDYSYAVISSIKQPLIKQLT